MRAQAIIRGIVVAVMIAVPLSADAAAISAGDYLMADPAAPTANGGVYHFDSAGAQKAVYSGGNLVEPIGVALDAAKNLIVTDPQAAGGAAVVKIVPSTGAQTIVSQGGSFVNPRGVVIASNGDILVADTNASGNNGAVFKVDPATGAQTTLYTGTDPLSDPQFLALEADGDILVSDMSGPSKGVIRVPAAGGAGTQLASGGNFVFPEGIAVASNGDVFVADNGGKVIKVDPVTGAQTLVSSGSPLSCPVGIAIESDGRLLVDDPCYEPGAIIRVDPSDGSKTVVWNSGSSPNGIIVVGQATAAVGGLSCPQPFVHMERPIGGETFAAGASQHVYWTSAGCQVSAVRLSLSVDGGKTYGRHVADVAAYSGGYYPWTVPDDATKTARMRIELLGLGGSVLATDASDADFEIVGTAAGETPSSEATTPEGQAPSQEGAEPAGSGEYDPQKATEAASDIDADKNIAAPPQPAAACAAGSLIKGNGKAVYYCGRDGKRYVFPNAKVFASWYAGFGSVVSMTDEELASIPLGGNVTYRPGVRLIKVQTDPKVYAVDGGGTLRWVSSEAVAAALYGADWNTKIDDVSDAFFADYHVGPSL